MNWFAPSSSLPLPPAGYNKPGPKPKPQWLKPPAGCKKPLPVPHTALLQHTQVRALAAAAGLATQRRADSQGICFLGRVKFSEFVAQHLSTWPGPLVDAEGGAVLGLHDGHWFYTPGQRGGIKLPAGPWCVVYSSVCGVLCVLPSLIHICRWRRT